MTGAGMSDDELFVTAISVALGPVAWLIWLFRGSRPRRLDGRVSDGPYLFLALVACAALIFSVLRAAASFDVRDNELCLFMYIVLGLAWLRLMEPFFAYLGVSARDDVIERRNRAATPAFIGALLGVTCCYAGGNVGDGPGWWVVVLSAALATASLIVVWMLFIELTPSADAIAIDRDPSAGCRLAGLLVGCGILLGRSVAGDWSSSRALIADWVQWLPIVLGLLGIAVLIERVSRPRPDRPVAPLLAFGVLPAAIEIGAAAAIVWFGPGATL